MNYSDQRGKLKKKNEATEATRDQIMYPLKRSVYFLLVLSSRVSCSDLYINRIALTAGQRIDCVRDRQAERPIGSLS